MERLKELALKNWKIIGAVVVVTLLIIGAALA